MTTPRTAPAATDHPTFRAATAAVRAFETGGETLSPEAIARRRAAGHAIRIYAHVHGLEVGEAFVQICAWLDADKAAESN